MRQAANSPFVDTMGVGGDKVPVTRFSFTDKGSRIHECAFLLELHYKKWRACPPIIILQLFKGYLCGRVLCLQQAVGRVGGGGIKEFFFKMRIKVGSMGRYVMRVG